MSEISKGEEQKEETIPIPAKQAHAVSAVMSEKGPAFRQELVHVAL